MGATVDAPTWEVHMLRADELTVLRHDDTVVRFTDVRYMLGAYGLRVTRADGEEILFPQHEVLTTEVCNAARSETRARYAMAA
jgi:hypothetical protein